MTTLRFRALAKANKIEDIEEIIQKEGYKKLETSPLKVANILFEFNIKDKAAEYARLETNPDFYEDKFNLLF